jgi:hypothetical protein
MGDEQSAGRNLDRTIQVISAIVAPTTLLTALLFYYGWIRTNALFQFFGVDAAVLGFTTQDYLLRSTEALYVPLGTLLLIGLAGLWLHSLVTRWLADRRRQERLRIMAVVLGVVGLGLFARGVAGVVFPELSRNDFLVTPACLGVGAILGAYGRWLWLRLDLDKDKDTGHGPGRLRWSGIVNLVLVVMLVVLSLFWATTNYARAYGVGRAEEFAACLAVRPGVTVFSADRLYVQGPGVQETALPAEEHAGYRYRYGGLRLLTEAHGRLILLPSSWSRTDGSAIVLANSDKLRIEVTPGHGCPRA